MSATAQPPAVTHGIHHVTAISGDAQRTLDFYAGVLGLRLVKRTVNFDDPGTYHFYFGDATGTPGSILTFFPWAGAHRGRPGVGQVSTTAFAIPPAAVAFWRDRLTALGVDHDPPRRRWTALDGGETVIALRDPDGMALELVADARVAPLAGWSDGTPGGVPAEHAVRGVHGVTLWVTALEPTAAVLVEQLGFVEGAREGEVVRYVAPGDAAIGRVVDVRVAAGPRATGGVGSVHHVAFRVRDDAAQLAVRRRAIEGGIAVTPVLDRNYFHSVYFREPGGVLFELATDAPGFLVDEDIDALGTALKLPAQYEPMRDRIERALVPVRLPGAALGVPLGAALGAAFDTAAGSAR